jgi:hypothetical protein
MTSRTAAAFDCRFESTRISPSDLSHINDLPRRRHGSEQRRRKPKVASSKAADADPARVLAKCRRTMAASLGFSGDINGLGDP